MIGMNVEGTDGKNLGNIKDLVIDPSEAPTSPATAPKQSTRTYLLLPGAISHRLPDNEKIPHTVLFLRHPRVQIEPPRMLFLDGSFAPDALRWGSHVTRI